ncbi:MAG: hypothetical protein OEO79_19240 [Gemmatimonadota bacterium]|nr:hypothetical protein [Gemmatimonadota bacterium]
MISKAPSDWTLSPFPAPYRFAFSIIHDADSGYSRRLRPVFSCLEDLGLRVTATAFPFWADWADEGRIWSEWMEADPYFAPVAVPLEDDEERLFFQELAAAGHEIAMHTPSETSSTREQLIKAFAYFESVLGAPPRMYVEHSPRNNLDAQQREGADPTSRYYNTDLLNESRCWVWVLDELDGGRPTDKEATNLLVQEGAPFSGQSLSLYGIARGFLRNGSGEANGDTFLSQYTEEALDALEADGGLALLYTHLNYGWLDPETRKVRREIRDRLAYIAEKPVWLATGTEILDRFDAMRCVHLISGEGWLKLVNVGAGDVMSIGIRSDAGRGLIEHGKKLPAGEDGTLVVERLAAGETRTMLIEAEEFIAR